MCGAFLLLLALNTFTGKSLSELSLMKPQQILQAVAEDSTREPIHTYAIADAQQRSLKTAETLCAGKAKQNSKQTCLFPSPEAESKLHKCFPLHGVSQQYMCCYDFCPVHVQYGNDSLAIFVIISQSISGFQHLSSRGTVMPHD